MSHFTRRTLLFTCGAFAMFAMYAKAQTEHTLLQQSQMKTEAELSPEEQKTNELDRIDRFSQFMVGDELGAAEDVKAGRPPRKPWNVSKVLNINENEANLIRIIMYQTYHRLKAIEDQQTLESLRGLSLQERAEKRRKIKEAKYNVCDETIKTLIAQLGKEDFDRLDAVIRRQYPWGPPRIVKAPLNTTTTNTQFEQPSRVRP